MYGTAGKYNAILYASQRWWVMFYLVCSTLNFEF